MSDPIYLFNADGEQVILYAPTYAREQVDAGFLFLTPPSTVEVSITVDTSTTPLSDLSVKELKELAKAENVPGYYRMKKSELIEALNDG